MSEHAELSNILDNAKLSKEHWRIWFLSAMGIFLDGFDLFIIAIALPFITHEFHQNATLTGLIVSAAPIGCILGSSILGRLTDHIGRKKILLFDLLFFVIFAGMTAIAWSAESLILFRFLLGVGIGADYPVSASYITENMPKKQRGKMLISGFGFQALGALAGALLGAVILLFYPKIHAWRWMLGIAIIPAIIVLLLRLSLPESTRWLVHKGKKGEAEKVVKKMTGKTLKLDAVKASGRSSYLDLFSPRYLSRTILTAGTWFIFDIAFYGVGFFTPIILSKLAFADHGGDWIQKDIVATYSAAFVDIFLIVGIIFSIFLVEKWGRIRLQALGFLGMAIGLFVIAIANQFSQHSVFLIFVGFILFNVMVNIGPNPVTFLLPAEIYPTHLRATGHGFAAACGKAGAVLGGMVIALLHVHLSFPIILSIIALACLLGFLITIRYGYETKGKSLDEISTIQSSMTTAEIALNKVQNDIRKLYRDLGTVEKALTHAIHEIKRNHEKVPR